MEITIDRKTLVNVLFKNIDDISIKREKAFRKDARDEYARQKKAYRERNFLFKLIDLAFCSGKSLGLSMRVYAQNYAYQQKSFLDCQRQIKQILKMIDEKMLSLYSDEVHTIKIMKFEFNGVVVEL